MHQIKIFCSLYLIRGVEICDHHTQNDKIINKSNNIRCSAQDI